MPPGIAIADTGPVNYLIQIGQTDLLSSLLGGIAVPSTVAAELRHPRAPATVRAWMEPPPSWFAIHDDPPETMSLKRLGTGERAAISLAQALGAKQLIIDDRAGVVEARRQGLRVTGTIGVLVEAGRRNIVHLATAFASLEATNFRYPPSLTKQLLQQEDRFRQSNEQPD